MMTQTMKTLTLKPNDLIEQLEALAVWTRQTIERNESEDLTEDCQPIGRNYSQETMETFSMVFGHAQLLHTLARHALMLWQGDLSEEQFHHGIDNELEQIENDCQECENED